MNYTMAAHPTLYNGTTFRSRLEARWAAFFDLAGWKWQYEPLDLPGWTPDFLVEFPCSHSECNPPIGDGKHKLLVEVKPYLSIREFKGHPCMDHPYGRDIPADSGAAFGINPDVTEWEMCHGAGGGIDTVPGWVHNADELWKQAGLITQYRKKEPSYG
jgi:hypothetical protein